MSANWSRNRIHAPPEWTDSSLRRSTSGGLESARVHSQQRIEPEGDYIRVIVIDSHPFFAHGMVHIVGGDIRVVGAATNLDEGLVLLAEERPDVVVADLVQSTSPIANSVDSIRKASAYSRILVLSSSDDPEDVYQAMASGVEGYLSKEVAVEIVVDTIRLVCRSEVVLGPIVLKKMLRRPRREGLRLTEDELRILRLVAEGWDMVRIAKKVAMSESTVRRQLCRVIGKLEVKNRMEAVVTAARLGLV